MKIKVISAIGGNEEILSVMESSTVQEVKEMIASRKRIPADTVIVVFRGQQLQDNQTLMAAQVNDGDKLYLITRTIGGAETNIYCVSKISILTQAVI
ncbi:MAG: ubiquitin-like domain-containing protein [Candidatus Thorarchaeota archaeon]